MTGRRVRRRTLYRDARHDLDGQPQLGDFDFLPEPRGPLLAARGNSNVHDVALRLPYLLNEQVVGFDLEGDRRVVPDQGVY